MYTRMKGFWYQQLLDMQQLPAAHVFIESLNLRTLTLETDPKPETCSNCQYEKPLFSLRVSMALMACELRP